jgi:hypothetical protein
MEQVKQTAIDWLLENLISEPYSEADFKHNSDCWDKAKEMEKEQLEKLKDFDTWKEWKNS